MQLLDLMWSHNTDGEQRKKQVGGLPNQEYKQAYLMEKKTNLKFVKGNMVTPTY